MNKNTIPLPPMSDLEFYQLTLLIECKDLTLHDLTSLDIWVEKHGRDGAWAPAKEVINTLESYANRPGYQYPPS
jgi:hypothetical protein